MTNFHRAVFLLFQVFFISSLTCATAGTKEIKFGGVWLRGSAREAAEKFPTGSRYAMSNFAERASLEMTREILKGLRSNQREDGIRIVDRIAPDDFVPRASSGRALVMACAINYEHFETTEILGKSKIFAEVGFDLLLCNFSDRNIVLSLPARLQYVDMGAGDAKGRRMLEELYEKDLVKEFLKLAEYQWSGELAFSTVGIGQIKIYDDARNRFPEWMKDSPEAYFSQLLASSFCREAGLPITPRSGGNEAVYFGLRENLTDASTLEAKRIADESADGVGFILRKPDYVFDLVIPGYQEAIAQRAELGSTAQYCAYCRLVLKDPSGKEIHNAKHDANVTALLPHGTRLRPVWLSSVDATAKMFRAAAKDLKSSKSAEIARMLNECGSFHH